MFSKFKKDIGNSVDSTAIREKGNALIEQELPKIQLHFKEKIGPRAAEVIHDDVLMTKCFESIYLFVPLPVRLVIKKPAFVEFCLQNRYRIAGIEATTIR